MVDEHVYIMCLYASNMIIFFLLLAPNLTVRVTQSVINSSAADVAINLTCTATVEESIASDEYQFVWVFDEVPINQSDGRINV